MADNAGNEQAIAQAIQDVTEKVQVLVHEEIELAKAEVNAKVKSLVKGIVVGVAAGVFAIGALMFFLEGLAWLFWYVLPVGDNAFFWGFFVLAAILLLLGAIAGFLAYKAVTKGAPPVPQMAIDEAKLIKETVSSSDPKATV